ncbi:hypothetical protein SPHI_16520 [Sphingomonas jeddahensis]|uniref:Uncharacterized protein n=1 Tax=Sphingomonas jeddahensis TaxID=1915074 RepID=A0A1V2EUQ2_9SPHN|nr:hypothetical protein SPHI_16520 [Sphingomonas jeddahensis]
MAEATGIFARPRLQSLRLRNSFVTPAPCRGPLFRKPSGLRVCGTVDAGTGPA